MKNEVNNQYLGTLSGAMELVTSRLYEIREGDRTKNPICYLPGNTGRIACVQESIFQNALKLSGVFCFQTLSLDCAEGWEKAVEGGVIPVTPFIGTGLRDLVNRGLARNIRCNLSQVPNLFKGRWKPDVAFAHVSEPDAKGRVTLGLNAGLDYTAVKEARFKVAVVNSNMPRFHIGTYQDHLTGNLVETGCAMYLRDFDAVVYIDEPLLEHEMIPKKEQMADADAVAGNILSHMEESAIDGVLPHTLQLGIGNIPNAFAQKLAKESKSIAGVWSETFSSGVLDLYEKNLIRNIGGPHLRDRIIVGFVLGSKKLYRTMHENPDFAVLPQEFVNDPSLISRNPYMTSINSTLAISLTGEVAAATIGTHLHSDVGGQFDFALGASWSDGGVSYIALSSTAKIKSGGVESKIVAVHSAGAHHTITADLPVVVVTENGVADLRFIHDRDRVAAMLRVASPKWRPYLAKEARKLPSMQGVEVTAPRLVSLRDGRKAVLRPVTSDDISGIKEYIKSLSEIDRYTRYMGSISVDSLIHKDRLAIRYDGSLDYVEHAAFLLEMSDKVIGIAHADAGGEGVYDISFSRSSDEAGQGIGDFLFDFLVEWVSTTNAVEVHAITYTSQNPRMRNLFDKKGLSSKFDPEDPQCVLYKGDTTSMRMAS